MHRYISHIYRLVIRKNRPEMHSTKIYYKITSYLFTVSSRLYLLFVHTPPPVILSLFEYMPFSGGRSGTVNPRTFISLDNRNFRGIHEQYLNRWTT